MGGQRGENGVGGRWSAGTEQTPAAPVSRTISTNEVFSPLSNHMWQSWVKVN